MKKMIITAVTAIIFSVTAFASTGTPKTIITGEEKVTYTALNQFAADFKNAKNVVWTVTSTVQKVAFTIEGVHVTAFYDTFGNYMAITQQVEFKDIPEAAQTTISTKYKGYDVAQVIIYRNDGAEPAVSVTSYFVDLKKAGSEVIVQVTPDEKVSLFKTVK